MAFIAEDGTGLADANSLCSVSDADTYFADRSNTAWAGTDATKEAALIRATDYIEMLFSEKFKGEAFSDTQALCWPRWFGAMPKTPIFPQDIKRAVCEYAVISLTSSLIPDITIDDGGLPVLVTKKSVAGITKEYKAIGDTSTTPNRIRSYPSADFLIAKWLIGAGGSGRTMR